MSNEFFQKKEQDKLEGVLSYTLITSVCVYVCIYTFMCLYKLKFHNFPLNIAFVAVI